MAVFASRKEIMNAFAPPAEKKEAVRSRQARVASLSRCSCQQRDKPTPNAGNEGRDSVEVVGRW